MLRHAHPKRLTRRQHRLRHLARPAGVFASLWKLWRGAEEIVVHPPAEFPPVTITFPRGEQQGAFELRDALMETWITIPGELRADYAGVLKVLPPMVVVEMRRRNPCGCLGHFHPAGTESELTTRIRKSSGVEACEVDLAFESIRAWQPAPIAYTAAAVSAGIDGQIEFELFHTRLALLDVFLHELHHSASPDAQEAEVRGASGSFYRAALDVFMKDHFGSNYGLSNGE